MTFVIRPIQPAEHEAARQLLLANGWDGDHFSPTGFDRLIATAYDALVALDGGRVIGFTRTLSDGVCNGYLCTLVVDEIHRKRGVARALVARAMGTESDMTWVLRAGRPGLQPFYEKLGFRKSEVAMERVRVARNVAGETR